MDAKDCTSDTRILVLGFATRWAVSLTAIFLFILVCCLVYPHLDANRVRVRAKAEMEAANQIAENQARLEQARGNLARMRASDWIHHEASLAGEWASAIEQLADQINRNPQAFELLRQRMEKDVPGPILGNWDEFMNGRPPKPIMKDQ